jgi:hypothetical protein
MSEHDLFRSRPPAPLRVAMLAAAAFAAATAAADTARVERAVEVPMRPHARYSSERCIALAAHDRLSFVIEAEHAVDFNVHHHTRTNTEYPIRRRVDGFLSGSLVAATDGEYCFMWTNPEPRPGEFSIRLRYAIGA